jgi:hypothetical protein
MPAQAETLTFPAVAESDAVEERVGAYKENPAGWIDFSSSDLEFGNEDEGVDASRQIVGLRFPNVQIDADTKIFAAYIQFVVDETKGNGNNLDVTIHGEKSLDAPGFSGALFNVSSRPKTDASVAWNNVPDWAAVNDAGPAQQTANLKSIIEEQISQPGWTAGNALAFILEGIGGPRTAESMRNEDEVPTLVIITTAEFPILDADDDVEEYTDNGDKDSGSTDLEIVEEGGVDDLQRVGLRFQNILIQPGAVIREAYIRFSVDETSITSDNRNPFNVTIQGEASADSSEFDYFTNFSVRDRVNGVNGTVNTVQWVLGADGDPENNSDPLNEYWTETHSEQRSPDLSAIIQEIIDQPGWEGGNALTLVLGSDSSRGERCAESYEGALDTSSPEQIPTLVISFEGDSSPPPAPQSTDKYRIMWTDEPTTTMTIGWEQLNGENPVVLYDTVDHGDDAAAYTFSAAPTRELVKLGMDTKFVHLTGLEPDEEYYFLIKDSNNQSRRMWFKTAPDNKEPIAFISGGDTKSSGTALTAGRVSNVAVGLLRPLFVFFTGDFFSGDGTSPTQVQLWLQDWSDFSMAADGQMFPLITMHGNHEDGDFAVLHDIFNTPITVDGNTFNYYAFSFADKLIRMYALNSQLYNVPNPFDPEAAFDAQELFLENDLSVASLDHDFTMAGYHKPVRPHTAGKRENVDRLGPLVEIFNTYGLSVSADGDSHMNKITFPVVPCDDSDPECFENFKRDDELGTLYIGEGSWGASPRANNDDKPWTIKSSAVNQFKWIHVFPDNPETTEIDPRMDIRTVKTYDRGSLIGSIVPNAAGDSFTIPEGIDLESYGPLGTVISYPFEAPDGAVPAAPTNFMGTAPSFNDVVLTWDGVDASDVTRVKLEQLIGGTFQVIASSIAPETTTFSLTNLPDNTTFTFRLSALNFFGESTTVQTSVTTPDDPRLIGRFQQDVNGYTGALDTEIREETKDTGFPNIGNDVSVDGDENNQGDARWVMLKFEDIFGDPTQGLIPAGAKILEARLVFTLTSATGNTIYFNRIPFAWDELVSWNDAVALGLPIEDDTIVEGIFNAGLEDASFTGSPGSGLKTVDVTKSLQAWSDDPGSNNGWIITNDGTNGWDFIQSDGGTANQHPLLEVFYEVEGDLTNDAFVDINDIAVLRGNIRQTASECPACDLDGDGFITGLDLRQLISKCSFSRCATSE